MSIHRAAMLAVVLVSVSLVGCDRDSGRAGGGGGSGGGGPPKPPPVPVAVATATRADVPIALRTIGSVESKARVVLRPQVAGRIVELAAEEGTDVQAGQVLVRLDPRPFEAVIAEAEANLARGRAEALDANQLAERTKTAALASAISARESEAAKARAMAADAQVQSYQALLDTAKLNLMYCTVSAPFAGRLGSFLVKPGSIVKENDTDLVELSQIDPIEVAFSIPEENIPAVRLALVRGAPVVEVAPAGTALGEAPAIGELTFVDNKVDPATGSIRLKAAFANADRRLWPGQFANVRMILGQDDDAVMVPEAAVQVTQSGPAVFVVGADKTVELRVVAVRRTVDGMSVIEHGIEEGETVVTDGQLRLAVGSSVVFKSAGGSTQGSAGAADGKAQIAEQDGKGTTR